MNKRIPKKINSLINDEDSIFFFADIAIYQRYAFYLIIIMQAFVMIRMKIEGFINSFNEFVFASLFILGFTFLILSLAHILNNTKSYRYLVINRDSIYFQKYSKFFGVGKKIKLIKKNVTKILIVFNETEYRNYNIRNSYLSIEDKKYNTYEIDLTFSISTNLRAELPMDLIKGPNILTNEKSCSKVVRNDFYFGEILISHLNNLGYSTQIINNSSSKNLDIEENMSFEE